ncbi:MAG TPA: DUF5518 domain-containing protein [Methanobacterium sp.]|nr:DUF5518 domain-containing protein [Methanobacterium sp.]
MQNANICPKCGHNNDEDAQFCEKCGFQLEINTAENSLLRWKAILMGLSIGFILWLIIMKFFGGTLNVVLPLIIGIITGYVTNDDHKVNVVNGALAAVIPLIILIIMFLVYTITIGSNLYGFEDEFSVLLLSIFGTVLLIVFGLIGSIGSVIGAKIKEKVKN